MIKIAHLSDLHFSHFSWSLSQFFSKRWLGNLNLLLNRSKQHESALLFSLIPLFKEKKITHAIISGDLTTTSSDQEYQMAKAFVSSLHKIGIEVFLIPGNHDHYTKKSYKDKRFYTYFPSPRRGSFSLSDHGVTSLPLKGGWHLVLMDTTYASSLISSNGCFSESLEQNLKHLLSNIPLEKPVILVNHFPFFQYDLPRRRLLRGKALEKVIAAHPNIQIYLHGHTHSRIVADLRSNHLPLILNSGATSHKNGSWNEMHLGENTLDLIVHQWENEWGPIARHSFTFETNPWYRNGLRFACTHCGKCCTKKGYVWLEEEDIARLSLHFNLTREAFIQKYAKHCGFDLALLDDFRSKDCIFLKDKKFCSVYEARPIQCRTFPWWPQNLKSAQDWEETKKECEGIDHQEAPLISLSEIKEQLQKSGENT